MNPTPSVPVPGSVAGPSPATRSPSIWGGLPADVPFAEVTRGGEIESRHSGAVAVALPDGSMWTAGPAHEGVWMRSAIKALQALPSVELGIADRASFTPRELALVCASHDGTERHVEGVRGMLAKLGLTEEHLRCGPHAPFDQRSSLAIAKSGGKPTRIHNNCSGKHTGFLALAQHFGAPLEDYLEPASPGQQAVRAAVADLAGLDPQGIQHAVDGCGAPTLRLPLTALARAFRRFVNPAGLAPVRAAACRRLLEASGAEPFYLAGEKRLCTALVRSAPGRVQPKNGAEGVYVLGGIGSRGPFGVAVKVADGAERGYFPVIVQLCARLSLWADGAVPDDLCRFLEVPLLNTQKRVVGAVRSSFALPPDWPDDCAVGEVPA